MNPRITLADIARSAHVDVSTVSLALRDDRRISEATRKRIRDIARALNYQPDPALRALVKYRSSSMAGGGFGLLAYLTNWDEPLLWRQVAAQVAFFEAAARRATELGYKLKHFWLRDRRFARGGLNRVLRAEKAAGIILAAQREEDRRLEGIDWTCLSSVKIDHFPRSPHLHAVTNDQRAVVQLAFDRAYGSGYRRIGMVMHHDWDHCADMIWSGSFLTEQRRLALRDRIPPLLFDQRQASPSSLRCVHPQRLRDWIRCFRPDVVISSRELIEDWSLALTSHRGQRLPFIDIMLTQPDGEVAGVRHNCCRVGELAVETVAFQHQHHLLGIPNIPTATLVEPTWCEGASLPASQPDAAGSVAERA